MPSASTPCQVNNSSLPPPVCEISRAAADFYFNLRGVSSTLGAVNCPRGFHANPKTMLSHDLWLLPLGLFIGAFGTLIGAGGGFILVPILLLLYPGEDTELITSTSLAVVFFNATSGTWAYSRMKRVDYKSGIVFAIATIPGAILGAITTAYVPRHAFDIIFGALMILAGIFLWFSHRHDHAHTHGNPTDDPKSATAAGLASRDLTDADGTRYHYSYNQTLGIGIRLFVGYASTVLGVGGCLIHVLTINPLLNFTMA